MHVLHKILAEGNQKENTQKAAQQRGEEDLPEVDLDLRIFGLEDVETGDGEDGAGDNDTRGGANGLDDDILSQCVLPAKGCRGTHGDDGDGNGGFEYLADLQARVCCRSREDDGHEETHAHRPACDFGRWLPCRHHWFVLFSCLQLPIGVVGQFGYFLFFLLFHMFVFLAVSF